jgi:serine/threonine-protein kinase RsbW
LCGDCQQIRNQTREDSNVATLNFFANLSQLETIHRFVEETTLELGLDDQTRHTLQTVVEEACTNVIVHAYGGQGGKMILTLEVIGSCLQVTLRDWGMPFDPAQVPIPDVTAPLEKRPLGGLGVYLMREMMDQVHFQFDATDGNTLVMVKEIQQTIPFEN